MKKTLSRGPSIDTEKCVHMVGSRFDLVLVASARAREIARQTRENPTYVAGTVSALLEIQNGKYPKQTN